MEEHSPPFMKVGSAKTGWMTLCDDCFQRISPLLTKECIDHISELNHSMLNRVNKRFENGSAAEEETLLKGIFERFEKLDTDSLISEIQFMEGGEFGTCLLGPPAGSRKEALRAQALADRLSAAYRDLASEDRREK